MPDGTLKAPSGGSYDDRPITPMKHTVDFDDPDIASATPPGLAGRQRKSPKENGASKKIQSPSKERNSEKAAEPDGEEENGDFEPPEGIPEDADAAETFYSQHEDFESDSEPDVSIIG